MSLRMSAAVAAFVTFTAVAYGQIPNPSNANVSSADRSFASKAAQAGSAEIADAQIALKSSSRQDVKDFARRMVSDHTKAADQLKSVASGEGLTLPRGESAADQKETDALQKLTGASFDRRYIEDQRKAHRDAVALFTAESRNGKNSQLKSFAAQTLPTLQDHLKMITGMPLTQSASAAQR
jgi:putative membrane protein